MKCRHCDAQLSLQMADLGSAPLSNAFHSSADEPEERYPLKVLVCENCWLAQTDISLFKLNHDEIFTREYPYYSSTSASWVQHAKHLVERMQDTLNLGPDSLTVEIGCNDGYLLQHLKTPCYGFEPTRTAYVARSKNIAVAPHFFTEESARDALHWRGPADWIVANNVLAHVPDINGFCRGVRTLLASEGVATFEFPSLLNMIEGSQFDTIYHEHYSYLSLTAVQRIFFAAGLRVIKVEDLPTHGGSLRVWAVRDESEQKAGPSVAAQMHRETFRGIHQASLYEGFQAKADRVKNDLLRFLIQAKKDGATVAGFGAAAKGNTLLNYAGIKSDLLPYVVDETPAKQGKFLPGSRIPVVDMFIGKPDYVLILPWNFKKEIIGKLSHTGCKFVTAVPALEVA